MNYIDRSWVMQIDITSVCKKHCIYCSRHLGHVSAKDRYIMTLDQIAAALDSLKDWPNIIGIMGGEPLLHPRFREIVELASSRVPKEKLHLWTSGLPNTELEDPRRDKQLQDAFGKFHYNPHSAEQLSVCRHQPLTIAVEEAVPDAGMMWKLINDCWLPRIWAPSIIASGAYFCEVAGPLDMILYQGRHAWKVEPDWWKKPPEAFQEQVAKLCPRCGMCLPMERQYLIESNEKFSPRLLEDFRANGAIRLGDKEVTITERKFTNAEIIAASKSWYPTNYRDDLGTDDSLQQWYKGIQTCLEPDTSSSSAFFLDTENEFSQALGTIASLCPEETPLEFAFYYQNHQFYPLREPYPFVLPEHPVENLLYFRAMLLHYRQIMDVAAFNALKNTPVTPELLMNLAHRYRTAVTMRRKNKARGTMPHYLEPRKEYLKSHFLAARARLKTPH